MAGWQQLLLLLFVAVVVADEANIGPNGSNEKDVSIDVRLPVAAALHRQKRHEIEIHRVIKRRPKLPPPPRGRKPRPPRRPGSKPRGKYGPPSVNFPPLSHYVPQHIDDPFSPGYESSYGDHHGSFGEPPAGYGSPIHPSPAFGSPPFAYGQTITSYEGSSYGKPSYDGSPSFGKHSFQGPPPSSSSASLVKPNFENSNFDFGFSKTSFGNGPSTFDSKVPSFIDSSSFDGFPGGKQAHNIGGYSHGFSHKQPSFADSTSINTYTTPSGKGHFYGESSPSSFGNIGSKHQLPLETYRKDPYKTPITSYEVPSNPKSNLFEPSGDFGTSYKRSPHNGASGSTHTTSHSSVGASEEEYIPSLPTRYDQEQFHTPTKANPNKPSISTLQTVGGDGDHFTSFSTYYDGGSESQKIPVKSKQPSLSFGPDSSDEQFSTSGSGSKRVKNRRKKKPKLPGSPVGHNLDTDDLRDAFGSSSDFHQVAIDADEFLDFEPKKEIKHSRPAGITLTRAEEPSNFVLLASQNKGTSAKGHAGRDTGPYRSPPSTQGSKSVEYDTQNLDASNFFLANQPAQGQRPSKPFGLDDLNILSIQKSNSKTYYAGSNQAAGAPGTHVASGFQPTRRRDMQQYRSAPASLDYTMLDDDDEENYDDISDIGTRSRGNRKKKDLSEKTMKV